MASPIRKVQIMSDGNEPGAPDVDYRAGSRVIVAEVSFDRDAAPEVFRQLGEALEACQKANAWIAGISELESLRQGVAPDNYSKAIMDSRTMKPIVAFYEPILVWAWVDYPDKTGINPVEILSAAIPAEFGYVSYPKPGGGL